MEERYKILAVLVHTPVILAPKTWRQKAQHEFRANLGLLCELKACLHYSTRPCLKKTSLLPLCYFNGTLSIRVVHNEQKCGRQHYFKAPSFKTSLKGACLLTIGSELLVL